MLELRNLLDSAQVGDDRLFLDHLEALWAEVWDALPVFLKPCSKSEATRQWFTAEADNIMNQIFNARFTSDCDAAM